MSIFHSIYLFHASFRVQAIAQSDYQLHCISCESAPTQTIKLLYSGYEIITTAQCKTRWATLLNWHENTRLTLVTNSMQTYIYLKAASVVKIGNSLIELNLDGLDKSWSLEIDWKLKQVLINGVWIVLSLCWFWSFCKARVA